MESNDMAKRLFLKVTGAGIVGAALYQVSQFLSASLAIAQEGSKSGSAEFVNRLACVIKADGSIARGFMIDSCEVNGENRYIITWKLPLQGEAKTNFSATIGSSMEEAVQPGLITVGLMKDPHKMQVHTYDVSGKPAKRSFHIAAFRDR